MKPGRAEHGCGLHGNPLLKPSSAAPAQPSGQDDAFTASQIRGACCSSLANAFLPCRCRDAMRLASPVALRALYATTHIVAIPLAAASTIRVVRPLLRRRYKTTPEKRGNRPPSTGSYRQSWKSCSIHSEEQKRRLLHNPVTRAKERCIVLVQAPAHGPSPFARELG